MLNTKTLDMEHNVLTSTLGTMYSSLTISIILRYPHYLFPYCQLVCHILSEATGIYAVGRQSTYKCEARAAVNRFGEQPMSNLTTFVEKQRHNLSAPDDEYD